MGYSAEVMQRARARLASAKADRESENLRHREEAYARVPRLKQIDWELRQSMALAAQSIFAGGEDVVAAMQEVRQANQALQAERKALIENYFEEGFLDDAPICDQCGGNGYVGSTMCECLQELCRQEQKKELTLLSGGKENFSQFRLEYYSDEVNPRLGISPRAVMERTLRTCRAYAAEFDMGSESLLFSGNTGLGKTFLSACIARSVADRGYSVVYETASRMFTQMERARFSGDEDARRETEKYTQCDLMIIDDLGTEMGGQFTTAALYSIINDRMMSKKPTIISTNLNSEDLEKRYSAQIASRLLGSYQRVAFVGEDIRRLKSRGF